MSIFEYDEEKHMKSEREWAYKNGHEDGHREGLEEGHREGEKAGLKKGEKEGLKKGFKAGEQRLAQLLQSLMDAGRDAEIGRVISDAAYREQLYREKNL